MCDPSAGGALRSDGGTELGVTTERVMLHKIELGLRQHCEHNRNVVTTVQAAEFGHLPFVTIRVI